MADEEIKDPAAGEEAPAAPAEESQGAGEEPAEEGIEGADDVPAEEEAEEETV